MESTANRVVEGASGVGGEAEKKIKTGGKQKERMFKTREQRGKITGWWSEVGGKALGHLLSARHTL